ncbi:MULTISPECIES: TRAP transporter large permease [Brevibacterium]|uniref:TRAP C4-dicarboxylate transport system permease DctM subunit domain-containing protein n=1 Tax=Brevibacterium salitolerans TaxID=1403566 RepID=A0ABP5IC64_9MICO|nr:TRAP transporter large permease [Brevibacterium sp.]
MIELILFGTFAVLLLLGVPVAFSMGLSAFAAIIWQSGLQGLIPASSVLYAGLSSETLLAIPFFILAGTIMEVTGISARLIEFADACVGHRKTGIALTTILVALLFSSISGSGPATVAAIGGILIPALAKKGYSRRHAASLVASAGELGIIIPPSIAYIVFAVVAADYERVSIGRLFMAGVVPGLILLVGLYIVAVFLPRAGEAAKANAKQHADLAMGRISRRGSRREQAGNVAEAGEPGGGDVAGGVREGSAAAGAAAASGGVAAGGGVSAGAANAVLAVDDEPAPALSVDVVRTQRASWPEIWRAFYRAVPGLLVPVIILGGIYGGIFTPTESAAVACVYGLVVGLFVVRELKLKDLPTLFVTAGLASGRIMLIIATATVFAYVITRNQIARTVADWLLSLTDNWVVIVLLINLILLIAGMFIDAISAFYLFVPLFVPVMLELDMDITTIGVMMTMNLALGLITPPVGIDLFVAAGIAKIPFMTAVKGIWPFLGVGIVVLMLVTFVPVLSNGLPDLLGL